LGRKQSNERSIQVLHIWYIVRTFVKAEMYPHLAQQ
jgi:hypothetical protein